VNASTPGNLGVAQGSIQIDVHDLQRILALTREVGVTVERNLGQIGAATQRAGNEFGKLRQVLSQVSSAFGLTLGAAGVVQLGRLAVQSVEVATAYKRQSVAAVNLAGSQSKLNELLVAYERATGGAIDRATALADVTRLQAVGFADSAAELEQFVTAARGISVATGQQQDYVISQLQLAIANQSTMRLDQLGLGVSEVKKRVDELRASDRNLTAEMAYQIAVLGLAETKFGALAKSNEAQATGTEQAAKGWKNLTLVIGQLMDFPVNVAGAALADYINNQITQAVAWANAIHSVGEALRLIPKDNTFLIGVGTYQRNQALNAPAQRSRFTDEQTAAIEQWASAVKDIERDAATQRLDATRQYEQQRTDLIADYELGLVRDAEDYARQQARAQATLEENIVDVMRDAAKRRIEMQQNFDTAVADAQQASAERLTYLRERYDKDRERAERSHRENLLDAAGRLDAVAVVQEQRRYAEESRNRDENYKDNVSKEKESLDERVTAARKAYDKQLADAREADAERIADLEHNYEEQQRLVEEDRQIALTRQAEDHANQLTQMDRAQADRLAQIDRQAGEERTKLDEAFTQQMADLGKFNDAWKETQDAGQRRALASFDEWWKEINKRFEPAGPPTAPARPTFAYPPTIGSGTTPTPGITQPFMPHLTPGFADGGPVRNTGMALVHGGEYVLNAATASMLNSTLGGLSQMGLVAATRGARNIRVDSVNISVAGSTNMGAGEMYTVARQAVVDALGEITSQ